MKLTKVAKNANLNHGEQFAKVCAVPLYIRLTRKFAEVLNGLDLRPFTVGQVIDMQEPLALMLLAERWAEPATSAGVDALSTADDRKAAKRGRSEGV